MIAETIDGEVCPNVFGLALLTDRTVPEIRRYWTDDINTLDEIVAAIPAAWMRDAKRRTREAEAHANTTSMEEILRYWATKRGCTIQLDCDGRAWIARTDY